MRKTSYLTLGDVARKYGCKVWQVRRLFELGILPPAERIGVYRVVRVEDLPTLETKLIEAGYIKAEAVTA